MGVEAELREEFDRWEGGRNRALEVLPHVLLGVSVVIALVWRPPHLTVVLVVSAVALLWILCSGRLGAGTGYVGLLALAAVLVALAPWYAFLAFAGYPGAFRHLRGRWRYAGATATATISAAGFLGGAAGIRAEGLWWAWLGVALVSTALAWAAFSFAETSEHRHEEQRRALVELRAVNARLEGALAENAGLHARLVVQAHEGGVLDERQRMAREIHDTLAQGLAGILTQLQAAEQSLADPSVSRRHLASATDLARESLTEARRSVHAVEPSVLARSRLPEAIGDVTARWSRAHHVEAALTTTGDARPMHPDVEVTLLRTAQEALANVAKHARAGRVGLTLSYMEDLVTLDVRDDGVGFDPAARRANGSVNGGFGLAGMRQRVQRLAGRLDVESEPGGGTAVSATVPNIPLGGER